MAAPKSAWRLAGDALLADGEWHEREEVLGVMAAAVPAGIARRARRSGRDRQRLVKGGGMFEVPRTIDEEVAIGARSVSCKSIRGAARSGAWVIQDGRVKARSRPCPEERDQ